MKIFTEYDLSSFEPWSGAIDTWKRIEKEGKMDDLECLLEDVFSDSRCGETELNDFLRFDWEYIFEALDIRSEYEILEEIRELEEQLEDLESDYLCDCEDLEEDEKEEIYISDYKEDMDYIKCQIEELEE